MFVCPNCDEKIHWRYSLTIKPQSILTCTACGAKLSPVKRSYNMASLFSFIIMLIFLWWVITTDFILSTLLVIPLVLAIIAVIYYLLISFENRTESRDKF